MAGEAHLLQSYCVSQVPTASTSQPSNILLLKSLTETWISITPRSSVFTMSQRHKTVNDDEQALLHY